MLVIDKLLSRTGTGSEFARQPRLPGGIHGCDDAEGSKTVPRRCKINANQNGTRCQRRADLFAICGERGGWTGLLGDHSICPRLMRAFGVNEPLRASIEL